MNQDFSELVEYLDKKFEQTATKEGVRELRVEMEKDIRELRIETVNLKEDVREVKSTLSQLQETVHELVGAVDKLAKAVDDLRIEYSAMTMQIGRHEKWIQQIAGKLGLKLDY
ncbi:MAG TPA: hypothetical protein VJC15_03760 [Candidatus Paceibacterota bacterium]